MRLFTTFPVAASLFLLTLTSSSISTNNFPHCVNLIPGEYIIELRHPVDLKSFLENKSIKPTAEFRFINAFAAHFSQGDITALCKHSSVANITPPALLETNLVPTGIETFKYLGDKLWDIGKTITNVFHQSVLKQPSATWNLHRLNLLNKIPGSEQELQEKADGEFFTFEYDADAGENVDIYVVDSGIFVDHKEFGGRAINGWSYINDDRTDHSGHGTHVAGIIGSNGYGVAKKARIISVKVSNGRSAEEQGTPVDMAQGLAWIYDQHSERRGTKRHSVVNISGTFRTGIPAIDSSIQAMVRKGIHFVVAAGNSNSKLAQDRSPARVSEVITVGASNIMDERAAFSDYGKAVDVFAPGENIWSLGTTMSSNDGMACNSGTSMATAHVTGIVATILSREGELTPERMMNKVKAMAQRNSRITLNLRKASL